MRRLINNPFIRVFVISLLFTGCDSKQEKINFDNELQKTSYSLGVNIAYKIKRQKLEVDAAYLVSGVKDGLGNSEQLSKREVKSLVDQYYLDRRASLINKNREITIKHNREGAEFLEVNKKKEGVFILSSGVQYQVIKKGVGKTPKIDDRVLVNYEGTLLDGTEFDSSYRRKSPARFALKGMIPGWVEALKKMKEGDKWKLFIPPAMAYGNRGSGQKIPPGSVLLFELELLSVLDR